jgi:DNA repair protein RadC
LFILLTLNGAHNVISVSIVTIGIANKTIVHPREVFCKAISDNATAVIVCHNHPSGEVVPSDEDKQITKRIRKAGEIMGIPLLDLVVFTNRRELPRITRIRPHTKARRHKVKTYNSLIKRLSFILSKYRTA